MHAAAFVLLAMIRQAGSLQLFMPPREVAAKSRLVSGLDVAASSDGERVAWCEGMHGYDGACYVWMRGAMAPRSAQPFKEEVGGLVERHLPDDDDSTDPYDFRLYVVR